jgi:DNA polymerase I
MTTTMERTAVGRDHCQAPKSRRAFTFIETPSALEAIWPKLIGHDALSLDLETYGDYREHALNHYRGEIRLLTVARRGQDPVVFDLQALGYRAADWPSLFDGREVIIHNAAFDAAWLLEKLHVRLPRVFCTLSAAKILSNGDRSLGNDLGAVLQRYLNVTVAKGLGASDWGGLFLIEGQLEYAAADVRHLHALRDELEVNLKSVGLWDVFGLEMQLLPTVIDVQAHGMPVCRQKLHDVLEAATAKRRTFEPGLKEHLGYWRNFNSYDQVRGAFAKVGVTLEDTSESTLVPCEHPAAKLLLQYREADMERRQAESLLAALHADGRIHCQFKALGPETGRFASTGPNLQNVGNGPLRSCFRPLDEEDVLVVCDYSQIELRLAAWVSQDSAMLRAFESGEDLHTQTAAAVLGKPKSEVTKEDRKLAKALNFGLVYGQQAKGFVRYVRDKFNITLTEEEAQKHRDAFFQLYQGLNSWHQDARQAAPGVTEGRTILGRRRLIAEDAPDWKRFQAQVNFVVQGGAAEALKTGMLGLAEKLPPEAQLIGTVHDELILQCPRKLAEEVLVITRCSMTDAFAKLFPGLPVGVDGKLCDHWGEK